MPELTINLRQLRTVLPAYFVILFGTISGYAQPDWIDPTSREVQYPDDKYLIGFSSVYVQDDKDINEYVKDCRQYARIDLTESLSLEIVSSTSMTVATNEGQTATNFDLKSVTTSQMEAFGLKTEDYFDIQNNVVYGFAYVPKKELIKGYYKQLSGIMREIESILNSVESSEVDLRYAHLVKGLNLLQRAKGYSDMLTRLGITNTSAIMTHDQLDSFVRIQDELKQLKSQTGSNLRLSIQFLVDQLFYEKLAGSEVFVTPITFRNTGIATEFSAYFDEYFRRELLVKAKLTSKRIDLRVSGNYWINNDQLHVAANIHRYDGEDPYQLVAGESISLDMDLIERLGVAFEPIKKDNDEALKSFMTNSINGGLNTRIYTQKGAEGLYFKEGEEMEVYVYVSRPSYLRLINVWSDGQQLSLLENYYVDESMVNHPIKLPYKWKTACPCGVEILKLYAQKDPFPEIEITSQDGFEYIGLSLDEVMTKTRSLQSNAVNDREEFYFGESSLMVTTLPKKEN